MTQQQTPPARDVETVLGARYTLTAAGMAATDTHWDAVKAAEAAEAGGR